MEKDKRRVGPERQRRNAIVVVAAAAAVDGSLNILGIVGESDRVHNATDALESTLLRPGIESKIINEPSLRLVRFYAGTVARPDLSGATEEKKKKEKKNRCSLLKKFDVAFKDVVISLVISPFFSKERINPRNREDFHGIRIDPKAMLVVAASDLPCPSFRVEKP